jgi:YVTN family beta-propeller protein
VIYVSNENDNLVTLIDVKKKEMIGDIPVGVEPEGMAISPDGKLLVNTSETTNMAHLIDTQTKEMSRIFSSMAGRVSPSSRRTAPSCGYPRSRGRSRSSTPRNAS